MENFEKRTNFHDIGQSRICKCQSNQLRETNIDQDLTAADLTMNLHLESIFELMYDPTLMSENLEKLRLVSLNKSYLLHPRKLVLGQTVEHVTLSAGYYGIIMDRSSWGRHGLMIQSPLFLHENESNTNLSFELINLGALPIKLYWGMPIAAIHLQRLKKKKQHISQII